MHMWERWQRVSGVPKEGATVARAQAMHHAERPNPTRLKGLYNVDK